MSERNAAEDPVVKAVFDHNWELASFLIPMPLVRRAVEQRFYSRVEKEVYKNLSRLTAQWDEKVQAAIFSTATEAGRRFDELIATVTHLLSEEDGRAKTETRFFLERVREALRQFAPAAEP